MKTLLVILILFQLNIAKGVFSQSDKKFYGFFTGVSLNTNSYDLYGYSNSNNSRPAFNIGAFILFDIPNNFGMKFQGQYTNKGGITEVNTASSGNTTAIERKYTNTVNYLQFSMLPQWNINLNKDTPQNRIYFNIGGYLSFKLSASESIEYQTAFQNLKTEKDISGSISGTDAGMIFATGITVSGFLMDIRYDLGLTNIVSNTKTEEFLNINNNSVNFSVGWMGEF